MPHLFSKTNHKSHAQAMVEFALALPVLLIVVIGLLEAGRLMFLYGSVTTAAREAVRYGSAVGVNDSGVQHFQDCPGIRAAAKKVGFLQAFQDSDIHITYDRGINVADGTVRAIPLSGGGQIDPDPSADSCPLANPNTLQNGDRVVAQVSLLYTPILQFIPLESFVITASSARTVIVSVDIEVTAPPLGWNPNATDTPTNTPTDTPTNTPTSTPTDTPTNTSTPTDTPTATLTPLYTFTPSLTPIPSNTPTLTPTSTFTLTPTVTRTPTITLIPTQTSTPVNCMQVRHGDLTISGNTMLMSITNNTGATLNPSQVTVTWNNEHGHQDPPDKTLRLQQVILNSAVWLGDVYAPSYTVAPYFPTIPTGTSTIRFAFHQTYNKLDHSERIVILLSNHGCENYSIDSDRDN